MSCIEWRGYEIRLLVIICGIFGTFFAILSTFYSANVSATTYSASISTSTSLSIDASSVGNGTSVGVDNLTVTSTCPSGYNITIEGPSDTNLYLNGDSSNNASGTYIAHSTGTPSNPATITGANKGTWGYSTSSSTGTGNFIGLTNSATTLYSKNSASASGGDSIPVYYGVSVPTGLAPGTYQMPGTSAITYYLTRSDNCVSYSVSFNANGGSGTMDTQRIYEGVATSLTANTFTAPTGKVFKEWNTAADGTGTSYSNQQSVTNITIIGSTIVLYAQWIEPIYIQNITPSECTTTPKTVYDIRDNQPYTIQRLLDDNCWIMENLNLGDIDNYPLNGDLTSSNTNINTTITKTDFESWKVNSYDPSTTNLAGKYLSISGIDSTSSSPYGTVYNYCAASASTVCSNRYDDASYDICPKGWRLPTGQKWGELSNIYLYYYHSYAELRNSIANNGAAFSLAGRLDVGYVGTNGHYWSSTSSSTPGAKSTLEFRGTSVYSNSGLYPEMGAAIRCVLDHPPKTINDITYLQDLANLSPNERTEVSKLMVVNQGYTLIDNRDDQSYTVSRLSDGKIWMIDNLNLGATNISNDLTSSNTNLSTTITASTFNSWRRTSGTGTSTAAQMIPISGIDETSGAKLGVLYNLCAASAKTACKRNTPASIKYDICPRGWRLPDYGETKTLYDNYNSNALMRAPLNNGGAAFSLAGRFNTSTPESTGTLGQYVTTTYADVVDPNGYYSGIYTLRLDNTTNVAPQSSWYNYYGMSVRCVRNKGTFDY